MPRRLGNRSSRERCTVMHPTVHTFCLYGTVVPTLWHDRVPPAVFLCACIGSLASSSLHSAWNFTPQAFFPSNFGKDTWKVRNITSTIWIEEDMFTIFFVKIKHKVTGEEEQNWVEKSGKMEVYQLPPLITCLSPSKVINQKALGVDAYQSINLFRQVMTIISNRCGNS